MLTKKFVKRSFTFKFYVKVWSCNNPFRVYALAVFNSQHVVYSMTNKFEIYCYNYTYHQIYYKNNSYMISIFTNFKQNEFLLRCTFSTFVTNSSEHC